MRKPSCENVPFSSNDKGLGIVSPSYGGSGASSALDWYGIMDLSLTDITVPSCGAWMFVEEFPIEGEYDDGDSRSTKSFNIGMVVVPLNASCKGEMLRYEPLGSIATGKGEMLG